MFEGSQSSGFWVKVVKVVRDIGARLKKYRTLTQSSVRFFLSPSRAHTAVVTLPSNGLEDYL